MPTHQGQTDQVLKIQLSSFIVAAQWIQDVGAVQGELTLEVRTAYVGNGAPIEVEVRDGDGKTYTQLKGAVHANFFRARFKADKAAGQNRLTFQAKLPKHGLQADSGVLPLRPLIEFTQLQWLDAEGKPLDHLTEGQVITLSAQVKGLQEGDIALGRIFSKTQAHGASVDLEADAQVAQGKVQLTWKHVRRVAVKALPNHHQHQQKVITYQPFEYTFEFSAFGVSAKSDPIPLQHTFELTYGLAPGVAGDCEGKKIGVIAPDGKRTDYAIPADGRIVVKDVIAGHYQIDESALDQPEEDTFKPAIDTTQSAAGASSGEGSTQGGKAATKYEADQVSDPTSAFERIRFDGYEGSGFVIKDFKKYSGGAIQLNPEKIVSDGADIPNDFNNQCVSFVRYFGLPQTSFWKKGPKVCDLKPGELKEGTVVATLRDGVYHSDNSGRSHVGIYLMHDDYAEYTKNGNAASGVKMMDQWKGATIDTRLKKYSVDGEKATTKKTNWTDVDGGKHDTRTNWINDGEEYYVVLAP